MKGVKGASALASFGVAAFSWLFLQSSFENFGMRVCGAVPSNYFDTCFEFAKKESVSESLALAFCVWVAFAIIFYALFTPYASSSK